MLKTVAEYRPPKSVDVPQTVGCVQSVKNLVANSMAAATNGIEFLVKTAVT